MSDRSSSTIFCSASIFSFSSGACLARSLIREVVGVSFIFAYERFSTGVDFPEASGCEVLLIPNSPKMNQNMVTRN